MDETEALSPRTDTTDDVSEYDETSSEDGEPRATSTTSETSGYSGSDDDGTPSDKFFSDDECSAEPPPADPPPASPPPAKPAPLHLLPKCSKCVDKLVKVLDNLEAVLGIEFDEHGVAVLPRVFGMRPVARDRGTVSFKLKCTCPKVEVFSFTEAVYQTLYV